MKEAIKKKMAICHDGFLSKKMRNIQSESSIIGRTPFLLEAPDGLVRSRWSAPPTGMVLEAFAEAKLCSLEEYKASATFREELVDISTTTFI